MMANTHVCDFGVIRQNFLIAGDFRRVVKLPVHLKAQQPGFFEPPRTNAKHSSHNVLYASHNDKFT